jgi:hypothetical protein
MESRSDFYNAVADLPKTVPAFNQADAFEASRILMTGQKARERRPRSGLD